MYYFSTNNNVNNFVSFLQPLPSEEDAKVQVIAREEVILANLIILLHNDWAPALEALKVLTLLNSNTCIS